MNSARLDRSDGVEWVLPDWPAPSAIHALTTTRAGGTSRGAYAGLNLATHVGDDPLAVRANREALRRALGLPDPVAWLDQVHGCEVVRLPLAAAGATVDAIVADAAWCTMPGEVCAVLTADCLPVVLAAVDASLVAVAHAGWRGLAAGVLEATLAALPVPANRLLAWLGPAIGPRAFEVGGEVRAEFCAQANVFESAFVPSGRAGHWLADLPGLARRRLQRAGVGAIYGGGHCTVAEAKRFFSYRRDGSTGRMATLVWIAPG